MHGLGVGNNAAKAALKVIRHTALLDFMPSIVTDNDSKLNMWGAPSEVIALFFRNIAYHQDAYDYFLEVYLLAKTKGYLHAIINKSPIASRVIFCRTFMLTQDFWNN